jgi:DNA-binding FadR family transcriptional regulator
MVHPERRAGPADLKSGVSRHAPLDVMLQLPEIAFNDATWRSQASEAEITFAKVHEVRLAVETHIASVAAARSDEAGYAALLSALHALALPQQDAAATARLDAQFHRVLASLTCNELYVQLFDSIADSVLANLQTSYSFPYRLEPVVASHMRIVDAVRAHDPEAARDAMERQLALAVMDWREYTGLGIQRGGPLPKITKVTRAATSG